MPLPSKLARNFPTPKLSDFSNPPNLHERSHSNIKYLTTIPSSTPPMLARLRAYIAPTLHRCRHSPTLRYLKSFLDPLLSILLVMDSNPTTEDAPQIHSDTNSDPPPSPPPFNPKEPAIPVSYPLKTLEELESRSYFDSFHFPFNKSRVKLHQQQPQALPQRPRILVCHDMQGGYVDDKWVQGGNNADAYAIWHWYLIDVFVYFSHNLVTLPPPCWTNTAHKHGVQVSLHNNTLNFLFSSYPFPCVKCSTTCDRSLLIFPFLSFFFFGGWLRNDYIGFNFFKKLERQKMNER